MYENLISLAPTTERYRERIINLYQRLHIPTKELEHRIAMIEQCMREHKFKSAQAQLMQLDADSAPPLVAHTFEQFILAAIEHAELPADQIEIILNKLMLMYLEHDLHKLMRQFLARLQALDSGWHDRASKCLKD